MGNSPLRNSMKGLAWLILCLVALSIVAMIPIGNVMDIRLESCRRDAYEEQAGTLAEGVPSRTLFLHELTGLSIYQLILWNCPSYKINQKKDW
jgi:hypothetical protein